MLDSPASPELAWRCDVQLLDESSDDLIGAAKLQLIEHEEALPEAVAARVEVGDAVAVDAAMQAPRLLAGAPPTARGRERPHVNDRAIEQLVRVG